MDITLMGRRQLLTYIAQLEAERGAAQQLAAIRELVKAADDMGLMESAQEYSMLGRKIAELLKKSEAPEPDCATCNDTHQMAASDGNTVMCTHCPHPCDACCQKDNGPYCATNPCKCDCHNDKPNKEIKQ